MLLWGEFRLSGSHQERFHELCKEWEATKDLRPLRYPHSIAAISRAFVEGRIGAHANRHVSQKSPDEKCWL